MGGNVIEVSSNEEWASKIKQTTEFGGKAMIVDFTASWCGPCKMIAPIYEQLSNSFPTVLFLKVDVDELQEVAQECGVTAMPTFQAYFKGEKVDEMRGADPSKLKAMVEGLASKATTMGAGNKLGGSSTAAPATDDAASRRAMMAAAAEARMKALQGS